MTIVFGNGGGDPIFPHRLVGWLAKGHVSGGLFGRCSDGRGRHDLKINMNPKYLRPKF